MNRVFYIFRHGETNWNRERRCQGHTNIALNEVGLSQALELAQNLLSVPLDVIVSSDLERALETGKKVASIKSIPLIIDARLREMSYGQAEGMLFEEAIETFGKDLWQKLQSFKVENDHVGFPGGETRKIARERFLASINHLIKTTEYNNIGISTHGGALRNTLHYFLPETQPLLVIPNCVVYRLIFDPIKEQFIADSNPFTFK